MVTQIDKFHFALWLCDSWWADVILLDGKILPIQIETAKKAIPIIERLLDFYRALAAWNPDHLELDDADRAMLLALLEPDQGEATSE